MFKNRFIVVLFATVALALIGSVHSGAIENIHGGPIDAADGQVAEPSQLASIIDRFTTALHEIGQALGLKHSTSKAPIMFSNAVADFEAMPPQMKIQLELGKRRQNKAEPKFCNLRKYDAVLFDQINKLKVIAGDYYYAVESGPNGKRKLVSEKWPGAPDRIDAAFTHNPNIYMFSGEKVWKYTNDKLATGFPKWIRNVFPGFPTNLDAVMGVKSKNVYAFQNGHFWRYDLDKNHVDHSGEVDFFGVPSDIDAARYSTGTNSAYFYKDNHTYVFDFGTRKTKQTDNEWMRC